jgi:hypothetical protein
MALTATAWWEVVLTVGSTMLLLLIVSLTWVRAFFAKTQPIQLRIDQPPTGQLPEATREIVLVDYVDRELLNEIASQKQIATSDVALEDAVTQSESSEQQQELGLGLSLPGGTVSAGGKASSRETLGRSRQVRRSMHLTYSTRGLIEEVTASLDRDGQLRRDILDVPGANEDDADLLQGLIGVWSEWGIDQLPKPLPEGDPRKKLDEAIDLLMDHATERTLTTKLRELRALAESTKSSTTFALAETDWDIVDEATTSQCSAAG